MSDLNLGSVEKHFVVDRGARMRCPFTVSIGGVAQDWAGWGATFVIAPTPGATATITLTQASGITLSSTDGEGVITITDTQTGTLTASTYYYYFRIIDPAGQDIALTHGRFQVRQT